MFDSIVIFLVPVIGLIAGLILLAFSSDTAVEHSVDLASGLGVAPLIIGLVLVSIGTDLPEIFNSILSSQMGHGDINVGDSLGSILAQITLVVGLLPFLAGTFKVKRKEVLVIGASEILSIIIVLAVVEKGYISRLNAFFLILSWFLFTFIIMNFVKKRKIKQETRLPREERRYFYHFRRAALGFAGVAVGAYFVIQSVIALSEIFNISEYIVSFFAVAIGTSLPELFVNITALRKKEYELVVGNTLGSCIFDACFSVGIGPLLFPISVSGGLALLTGSYALFGSVMVILLLAFREKVDRKAGAFFIAIYFFSYIMLSI
jgi:cation:H+ antiporter